MEKVTSITIEPTENNGSIVVVNCEKKEEGREYPSYHTYKYVVDEDLLNKILAKVGYLDSEEKEEGEKPKLINPKNW